MAYRPMILIADENPQAAQLLANYVKSGGYDVTIANDLVSALLALRETRPDLLLVQRMLLNDVGEMVRFVRRTAQLSGTGIIVLDPTVNQDERIVLLDAGADDCVPFPAGESETMARVRAVLRRVDREQRSQKLNSDS